MLKLKYAAWVCVLWLAACGGEHEPSAVVDSAANTPVQQTSQAIFASAAPPAASTEQEKYPPASVEMQLQRLSEHVYYVQGAAGIATDNQGFISNAAVIVTDEGLVFFDALGTPSLAKLFLEKVRTVTDLPVKKVIVSHYHADHIYGLQIFKELGAEILAPAGAQEYLGSEAAQERLEERQFSLSPWVNENTVVVEPDEYLTEKKSFTFGGVEFDINVLGSAHSDGDLTLYVKSDRVFLSGDIIFEGRIAYVGDADTKQWLETLESLEVADLVALLPGHGPAAKNPQQAIAATRKYLAYLRENMSIAVEEFISFDERYREVDWSEFEKIPAFDATNRRNAYQVFLSIEQEVLKQNP